MSSPLDAEALNDRLAREHPIDDYYARSPLPVRLIEEKRLAIIRAFLGDARGLSVCEVGSGGGHVLRMFPEAKLTAVDVSGVFLETARKNLAGLDATFLKGEIGELGLPERSFDRMICTEVLEHTEDPGAILAAIARLLKPGGLAAITVPNDPLIVRLKAAVRWTPLGLALRHRIDWGGDHYHLHTWTPRAFEELLGRHLRVIARRSAPFDLLPIRACFLCSPR